MISDFALPITVITAGILLTSVAAPRLIRLARDLGIMDYPDSRRIHQHPIPRAGGLAIIFSFIFCSTLLISFGPAGWIPTSFTPAQWYKFVVAALLISAIGLYDDWRGISPLGKVSAQTVAALILVGSGWQLNELFGIGLSPVVSVLLTIGWIILITNAFNLIDGLDGLATGLAAIAALGILGSLVSRTLYGEALLVGIFIGTCVGFLRYNRHPARVFLGDTGSNFIGFFLSAITIMTGSKGSAVSYLVIPLLAFSVPLLDTILAIWRRSARKVAQQSATTAGVFTADLEHLHHRLLGAGLGQRDVVALLYLINAIFVLLGLVSLPTASDNIQILTIGALLVICLLGRYLPLVEISYSAAALLGGLRYSRRTAFNAVLYFVLDLLGITLALLLATKLTQPKLPYSDLLTNWLNTFIVWAGLTLFVMTLSGVYRNSSTKPKRELSLLLALSVIGGALLAIGYYSLSLNHNLSALAAQGLLFASITITLVLAVRTLPDVLEYYLAVRHPDKLASLSKIATPDDSSHGDSQVLH